MNVYKFFRKLPPDLLSELFDEFGLKKSKSREVMLDDSVAFINRSDPKTVERFFQHFKETAYPYELQHIAIGLGIDRRSIPEATPENHDKIFILIAKKIEYKTEALERVNELKKVEKPKKDTAGIAKKASKTEKWQFSTQIIMDLFCTAPYSFGQAVADVIDNSIDSGAENIDVILELVPDSGTTYVIIQDDGKGMDEDELKGGMFLGSQRDYSDEDLGKFGIGMKLSGLSQAGEVSVFSKQKKDSKLAYRRISVDHIHEKDNLELLTEYRDSPGHKDALHRIENASGTVVLWEVFAEEPYNMRRRNEVNLAINKKLVKLSELLSLIFHRYQQGSTKTGREIRISIQGRRIDYLDPLLEHEVQEYGTLSHKAVIPVDFRGAVHQVEVTFAVLPHRSMVENKYHYERVGKLKSQNTMQGLYFYRNDRIIMFGGWYGLRAIEDHIKTARVALNIPKSLDEYFRITPTKTRYKLPPGFAADLRDEMLKQSNHWEVNGKKFNFIDRAGYRYRKESRAKIERVTELPTNTKSEKGVDTRAREKPVSPKKKSEVKKKKIEVVIVESLMPSLVFTETPPNTFKIIINQSFAEWKDAVKKLKEALKEH